MNLFTKNKIEKVIWRKIDNDQRQDLNEIIQKSNLDRNEYIQIRNWYIVEANNSSNFFDKTIISLTIGVLWASAYFVNAKQYYFSSQTLLWCGWICLSICLWLTLYSFFLSEKVHQICLEKYDLEYEEYHVTLPEEKIWLQKQCNEKEKEIESINYRLQFIKKSSLILLVLWVIILGIFFYSNINVENHSNFIYKSDYSYGNANAIFFREY